MKKIIIMLVAAIVCSTTVNAQSDKELRKERQAIAKMSQSELNKKASKTARAEAKRLKKEGWQVAPGALPIDKQLDRVYKMQYEFDNDLMPKYFMGEAMSTGSNYDAAKRQAIALATDNMAATIQTEVTALIENTVANEQLTPGEAESITRTLSASKNLVSQSISGTMVVTEMYRTLPNKNKDVLVRIAYSSERARQVAKKVIREELEKKGEDLHGKLDKLLGL